MATNDTILIDGILDNIISKYNMENSLENHGTGVFKKQINGQVIDSE